MPREYGNLHAGCFELGSDHRLRRFESSPQRPSDFGGERSATQCTDDGMREGKYTMIHARLCVNLRISSNLGKSPALWKSLRLSFFSFGIIKDTAETCHAVNTSMEITEFHFHGNFQISAWNGGGGS